ncbi:hypothetical protein EYZ11_000093 [Aspergillus tanneri]|uniref:Uncharacterized protein n=1 Tax=Aspergillus tanneri TaxID=1220188 RepID=A0A4S3JXX1_9EURO|nr:uncharacterized protein ATNIH1004_005700 [Aspergillus tanneri]KAA8647017.1 hypothetical protein ATNIH1004_005700 [Aspergillus tanneri]THD00366.1 hypothetical protein EYZ11_000093 [Aspergillus tanneri]
MPALTTVVAIAVSCAAVVIVATVVGTIVWLRIRQERLSLAVANVRQGPYNVRLQTFPTDTLTELSREEGSALRQYGQLPYGKPTEWGLLASRESLVQDSEALTSIAEKARGLRRSLSRSQSVRRSKSFTRPSRKSSLAPLKETQVRPVFHTSNAVGGKVDVDNLPTSAVEGVVELPTERTPRHTPERDEEGSSVASSSRPLSGPWTATHQRERSSNLFPVIEDNLQGFEQGRPRAGSITAQSPGTMPEQPMPPPPPTAYPPNRFRLSKNDSTCFSSLSLETADSSILLDDSRRASAAMDSDFTSPALPPCPMFAPYSANDVGRMEYERRSYVPSCAVVPAPFVFPANSPAREVQRREPDRTSPRRSLTARSPSHSLERISPPPRRSESLSNATNHSRRESMYADLDHIPPLNPATRNTGLLPYFSQMQRHSLHGNPRKEHDPFVGGVPGANGLTGHPNAPGRRPNSFSIQETYSQTSACHPRPPLPSALKGGSGPRKGHRRQNCVRISIHPPITFGAPTFSPMVEEEPEEFDDKHGRRSDISEFSASNVSLLNSSVSSLPVEPNSYQDLQNERPQTIENNGSRPTSYGSPSKKRKHTRNDSGDSLLNPSGNGKALPELLTSLPTTTETNMSSTPSPEKVIPVWMAPTYSLSPTAYENSPSPGSPRRSAVKGPRIQPAKSVRSSVQSLHLEENAKSIMTTPSSPVDRHPARSKSTLKVSSTKLADSVQHTRGRRGSVPDSSSTMDRSTKEEANKNSSSKQSATQQPKKMPSSGANEEPSANGARIVPIWEDRIKERRQSTPKSTIFLVNDPTELQGEISPSPKNRIKGRQRSKSAFVTPTKKTVGLGIGAATPVSLYDGDGFLKE